MSLTDIFHVDQVVTILELLQVEMSDAAITGLIYTLMIFILHSRIYIEEQNFKIVLLNSMIHQILCMNMNPYSFSSSNLFFNFFFTGRRLTAMLALSME